MKFYKMNGGIKDSGEQSIINCRTGDYAHITERRIYLDISSDIKIYVCTILCEHYFEEGFQFVVTSEDKTPSSYVCDYATGARIIKNNIAPLLYGKMTAEQLGAILNEMQYNYAHKIRRRRTEGQAMKFYKVTGQREYGEQPAADCRTGEAVTITERRAVMDISDYIKIYRCEIVSDSEQSTGFQFLVMPDGYTLSIYVCDYATGAAVISDKLTPLLAGYMSSATLDVILNRLQQSYIQGNK